MKFLKSKFVRDTGVFGIASMASRVLSYLIIVIVSRYLGAEGLGQYSFIYSLVALFFLFSDMGLSHLMIKDLSKDFKKAQLYISNILGFKLIALTITLALYIGLIPFIGKDMILGSLLLGGIWMTIEMFRRTAESLLRIKQDTKPISLMVIIERLLVLVGALIFIPQTESLFIFLLILVIAKALETVGIFINSVRYVGLRPSFDKTTILHLLRKGYPFMLFALFATIYVKMDTIMLSFLSGDIVTGWYNAPYKLIDVLNIIPMVLMVFGFPQLSRLYEKNKKRFAEMLEVMIKTVFFLILPIILGVFLIGDQVLHFIYGFSPLESVTAFKILIIVQLFALLTTILGYAISADRQQKFAQFTGIGAAINIIFNFILIPRFSLYGAAVATLLTYLTMFLIMYRYIFRQMTRIRLWRWIVIPLIGSIGILPLLIQMKDYSLFLSIPLAGALYLGITYSIITIYKKTQNRLTYD